MSATIRMQGPSHAAAMAYNRLMKPLQGLCSGMPALATVATMPEHAARCVASVP